MQDWSGKRVVIIGAARQGVALARYLADHGAKVVLNDLRPLSELEPARNLLGGYPVEWVCGSHPLALLESADLVCPSGGVPLDLPLLAEARQRGIPFSNDSQIFLEAVPCRVIGITGSAGKTTTTALVSQIALKADEDIEAKAGAKILRESGRNVWVGGNIGAPLIDRVDQMKSVDLAVMELSSFQLELMNCSPQVAGVLNLTPNHLDRHGTMEAYRAAKLRILQFQKREDVAVLNREDPGAWSMAKNVQGRLASFGFKNPAPNETGTYLDQRTDTLMLQDPESTSEPVSLMSRVDVALRGEHNMLNVLAACAIAHAAKIPVEAMRPAVKSFRGVPHRLEFVRSWGGADWYNDSIATAPERVIAAMRSFNEPLVLLAGGRDKNLPWEAFAELVRQRVEHLILFGETADLIEGAVRSGNHYSTLQVTRCKNLREAVEAASQVVSAGQVVLLSPGGTSFDEFRDFEARGEAFKKWVMELP